MVPINLTTTDTYQYVNCAATNRVNLQVSNAAISIGFGRGIGGAAAYGLDEPYLPLIGGLSRQCDQIRIRSLTAGQPAVVLGAALGTGD